MRWGNNGTEELEQRVADQAREIAELQAAVYTLTGLELASGCPQSTNGGRRGSRGDILPALQPFVAQHDPNDRNRVTRRAVGDS